MSSTHSAGASAGAGVARLLEQLRLAEAKLSRQRQAESSLNDTDRAAMRYILENDVTEVDVTPGTIATQLHLTAPAATAVVDRLVAGGLVTVTPHPSDRRKKLVVPFDRNIDPDHIDPLTTRLRAVAEELPADEATIVARFLQSVLDIVHDPGPNPA
jgi:DNA-binding MarR family transcriptional regulator